ncbi:MAG TPA: pyridoxal 5'-phosphate synthase glutaminase subunit PdxT [Ruminococcaceae bacterium]|nr:pyridoxal 5'-phosphate synthase glutaminase subunit PdxT [Oscillospiraceae bacterium]
MKTVGVLALQGSFREHLKLLGQIEGIHPIPVKNVQTLQQVDGIILPGGESTTQGKLLKDFSLLEPLKERILSGLPVWGTCAGTILLAKQIAGDEPPHLGVMDITIRRNAYGGQLDSFIDETIIPAVSAQKIPLVFIRAPWIDKTEDNVKVLASLNGKVIAAKQGQMLATSFHPELTYDLSFHQYFIDQIIK